MINSPDYRTTTTTVRYCRGCWFLRDDQGRSLAVIRRSPQRHGPELWEWSLSTAGHLLILGGYTGTRYGRTRTLAAALDHLRTHVFAGRLED